MDKAFLAQRAEEIIAWIKTEYLTADGILNNGKNIAEGTVDKGNMIDDLGDFLPFLRYFGEDMLCDRHFEYVRTHRNEVAYSRAYAYTDYLLGFAWDEQLTGVNDHRALAKDIEEEVWNKFLSGAPSSYSRFIKLPIFNSQDGTFLEVYTELYRASGDNLYLERAENLAHALVSHKTFSIHGLLPEWVLFGWLSPLYMILTPKKANMFRLMKNNTNFAFGILDLYRITKKNIYKDAFQKIYTGIHESLAGRAAPSNKMFVKPLPPPDLLSAFSTVDLMCDAYKLFGDGKYLAFARGVADYWMGIQSHTTGLFPRDANDYLSYLDSETDLSVALLKLAEITGESKYRDSALKAIQGIFTYHRGEHGYVLQVDIASGKHHDSHYKTKFITLLLKPIICLSSGLKIYEDEKLFMLLKDR